MFIAVQQLPPAVLHQVLWLSSLPWPKASEEISNNEMFIDMQYRQKFLILSLKL